MYSSAQTLAWTDKGGLILVNATERNRSMKYLLSMVLIFIIAAAALTGCAAQHDRPGQESGSQSPEDISTAFEEQGGQTTQPPEDLIDDIPPYDAMLNLIVMDGKFRFQRIATTPCIVYSDSAITDMENGTAYNDRHDILTTVFRAMDGKTAIMST